MKIGILALQGDFHLHKEKLDSMEVASMFVKTPAELWECQGLIMPGGESTTLVKLLKNIDLYDAIPIFAKKYPLFGTCAGAILVSQKVANHPVAAFGLIDTSIERNAYGTQVDSFIDQIQVDLNGKRHKVEAVFIRAPRFRSVGEGVRILARHDEEVVMIENEQVLAATFHPELTDSPLIHQYFIEKVRRQMH